MPRDIKGDRLLVNLSASQARRRLQKRGYGVRKVQSAGRGQAILVHTATGEHRRELEQLFHDVLPSPSRDQPRQFAARTSVQHLRNIGPTSGAWLREIGVETEDDLRRFGPVLAYGLIKQQHPEASLNLLWALAGALRNVDWRELPAEEKERLRAQWEEG